MLDNDILKKCAIKIKKELGGVDDLPYELQNTIANLYYDFFLLEGRFGETEKGIPKVFRKEGDIFNNLRDLTMDSLFLTHHVPKIPEYVDSLRQIKKSDPNVLDYMTELFIDMLKYKIKNTFKKTGIRRSIERKINKKKLTQYPDLIGIINSYTIT